MHIFIFTPLFILTLFTQSTIAAADDVDEYELDQFLQFFAVFRASHM
jgi:hypothetical protein